MDTQDRPAAAALVDELLSQRLPFSFFQAVRLLERVSAASGSIGGRGSISQEPILFRANASLAFAARDIESVERRETKVKGFPEFLMTVNFLGMYGPSSPLPPHYTEDILYAGGEDSSTRHFLDLFNHRFVSFFYRAWEKYRYYVQYRPGAADPFSQWMFALTGLGNPMIRAKSSVDWSRLVPYIGLLGMRIRSARVLGRIVSYYFGGCPVGVEQYVEHKAMIDRADCNRLGRMNVTLGVDSLLGQTVRDRNGKFSIRLGPLRYSDYEAFLPYGRNYRSLRELVMFIVGDPLEFDVELTLMAEDLPAFVLSRENTCYLGRSTWLGKRPEHDITIRQQGRLDEAGAAA